MSVINNISRKFLLNTRKVMLLVAVIAITFIFVSAEPPEDYIAPPTARSTEPTPPGPVCSREDNEWCFTDTNEVCTPGHHMNVGKVCDEKRPCCYCPENTYQPWYNQCPSCILCTDCAEQNKEMLHKCNITHDTVCGKKLPDITTELPDVSPDLPGTEAVTGAPPDDCNTKCDGPSWGYIVLLLFTHLLCFGLGFLASHIKSKNQGGHSHAPAQG